MKKKLMMLFFLCAAMVPATAQEETSQILIYKVDSTVDTLLLNNVREVYHSCLDANGVEQADISTLRLRTFGGERVYPLTEIDHVVMPKSGRIISFMGTAYSNDSNEDAGGKANAPLKTSVTGDFTQAAGTAYKYNWVSGDYIYLSTGAQSYNVQLSSTSTASNGRFAFRNDLLEDQYVVYYSGTNSGAYNKVVIPQTQEQTAGNNSDHLGKSGDCGTAIAIRQQSSNYSFALDHHTSILCFMPRVDSLETVELKSVAVKADKTIAGTYDLSTAGISNVTNGSDSITLTTKNFILPHQKATAQDSVASYMVVAPQSELTTFKVYYRVRDTRSQVDTTVVKNITIDDTNGGGNGIKKARVYPITSIIPVRSFLMAFTDSAKWSFGEAADLYGSVNLPAGDIGFIWGFNKNLTFDTKEQEISLTKTDLSAYPELKFHHVAVDNVLQKAYYYRAFAREGGRTLLGQVKKFGMEREIINMGTSVRWSSINMGAITAEDYGDYYAWGELTPKDPKNYSQANYQYYQDGKYVDIGNNIAGNPDYDPVAHDWRGCWRMPTIEELRDLHSKGLWSNITRTDEQGNEIAGYLVKNRNQQENADSTLFIPKNGYYNGTSLTSRGNWMDQWSGTLYGSDATQANYFSGSSVGTMKRYQGLTIRPVFESNYETKERKYPLFIRTDSISYSTDHTSTDMYGTMRGLDDVVTALTQGFVIGTVDDVTLESGDALKITLSGDAADNGSYHLPLTTEQMNTLDFGTTFYVRAFITYGEGEDAETFYGDPLEMLAMTIQTDSTDWAYGKTSARLCGTATGITESAKDNHVEIGFIYGLTPDIDIPTAEAEEHIIFCDSVVNGKYVCTFDGIEEQQYFYRAFVRQGNRSALGEPKMLGLEFVDLGLPSGLLWANINIGAQTPMDNGNYYAWGEVTTKETYTDGNYNWEENKGVDFAGDHRFDAAQHNWQSVWRMPTKTDLEELYDSRYCTWTAETLYGKPVYKVTSKINNKFIYLPMAGYWTDKLNYNDSRAIYWTSTLNGTGTGTGAAVLKSMAWDFDNDNKRYGKPYAESRWYGFSVRPVALVNTTLDDESKMQLTTDSVKWKVGDTEATIYGYQMGLHYHDDDEREVGFLWSTTENIHTVNDGTELAEGVEKYFINPGTEIGRVKSGQLSMTISNIEDNTVYFYRAYAKVNGKYYLADERQFGRKMVDLGLSSGLLWSNINLGASSPDKAGNYYAWGDTEPKEEYTTAKYTKGDIGRDISGSNYDAAHVNWGDIWRMPTNDDLQELLSQCTWTDVTKYGQPMYKVVGPNGDSIFIAKRGYQNDKTIADDGTRAALWTSVLSDKQSVANDKAFAGSLYGTNRNIEAIGRHLGYTVRPVAKYNFEVAENRIYVTTDSTDWYVGNATPHLCGAVYAPAGVTVAERGFVVGYKSNINDVKTSAGGDVNIINRTDEKITIVSSAAAPAVVTIDGDDDNIFRGDIAYEKDTTYYYRAYVKVGDDYYYGQPRRYGLEIVDLGLSTKWASLNLGSQISSDLGNRYAWGEKTANKSSYTETSYEHYANGYTDIGADISYKSYDAVKATWLGSNKWRMPTLAEMNELVDPEKCRWEWTEQDGQSGYLVTSLVEGYEDKSIFLPAAGYQDGSFYKSIDADCYYWTSASYDNGTGTSWYLHGNNGSPAVHQTDNELKRFYGFAIRPVTSVGAEEGSGGDITGGHKPGTSQQTGGDGSGSGNAGTGGVGETKGN